MRVQSARGQARRFNTSRVLGRLGETPIGCAYEEHERTHGANPDERRAELLPRGEASSLCAVAGYRRGDVNPDTAVGLDGRNATISTACFYDLDVLQGRLQRPAVASS